MLGAGGLGAYLVNPAIPMGLLGGAALYTQPGKRLLSGMVAARPEAAKTVADTLRQASPALIPGFTQMGFGLLN